jgi:serine/threonine-protein kinase RsbW
MLIRKQIGHTAESNNNETEVLETMSTGQAGATNYLVRRMQPEDALGVTDCVRRIYGDTYIIHTELYHPEQIIHLNQTGQLVSVVALDPNGQIVGHYALERPNPASGAAESGEAMVLPEHRHHHLLEDMRILLEEEAQRLGLRGIFGRTVTNHVFSQRAVERFGEKPCGVSLGRTPRTFRNMATTFPQRMSTVFYFKYLREIARLPAYLLPHHQEICLSIYEQFGVAVDLREAKTAGGTGQMIVDFHTDLQRASILVYRIAEDTIAAFRKARTDLSENGQVEVIYLELPLSQPGAADLCRAAEEDGFFFSGVAPLYLPEGDAIRMQFLTVDINTSLLEIENPFARRLLAFVESERQRIGNPA